MSRNQSYSDQRDSAAISQVADLIGEDEIDADGVAALAGDAPRRRADPPPAPAPSHRGPAMAATGAVGILIALNELLREHGATLTNIATNAGPVPAALALNWPHLVGLFFFGLWGHGKWERSRRQSRAQLGAMRLVAKEVGHVVTKVGQVVASVGALRADVTTLSGRVDSTDRRTTNDTAELRREVEALKQSWDNRFTTLERRVP